MIMNRINWTMVAVFSVVVLLVFLVGVSLLGGRGYGGWGAALRPIGETVPIVAPH